MKRAWLLLGLLALTLSAAAEQSFAAYDLALGRLVQRQGQAMVSAANVLNEWQEGRFPQAQVAAQLQSQRSLVDSTRAKIEALTAPRQGQALRQAALDLSKHRLAWLDDALKFAARNPQDAAGWRDFLGSSLPATLKAQRTWINRRLSAVQALRSPGAVGEYYAWQGSLLPLSREQVNVGFEAQKLVMLDDGKSSPRELQAQAAEITRRSVRLAEGIRKLQAPPFLKSAQEAAQAEQIALAELCGAVERYTTDRTEEAATTVRRDSRDLASRGLAAEEASLQALEQAVRNSSSRL